MNDQRLKDLRLNDLRLRLAHNSGLLIAIGLFVLLYGTYSALHPRGGSVDLLVQNTNESFALALVAMAQTLPVLTGGLDLSVGPQMTLIDCLASELVRGSPGSIAAGIALCLLAGMLCGFVNGCIIVYGRLQPIIVTLATGAIHTGIALIIRPTPGGIVDADLSWVMTNAFAEMGMTYGWWSGDPPAWAAPLAVIPMPVVLMLAVILLIWLPFRRSVTGRTCYAIGSAEAAAYMSGLPIARARITAYTLGGLLAGCGGLYLALQTGSGNADTAQAAAYTLNSIAAVVIGGTSLYGGSGGAIGSIFGVLVLRSISFIFRVIDADSPLGWLANPLLTPFFEGVILVVAVSLGAARVFRVKNRLNLFG